MNLNFRDATENDISNLVDMLADDVLGAKREDISKPLHQSYVDAFQSIEKDPNNELTRTAKLGVIWPKRCKING